jgi:hypothetical protein
VRLLAVVIVRAMEEVVVGNEKEEGDGVIVVLD